VHRRFAGKAALLRAVVMADVAAFADAFDEVWYGTEPVASRVVDAFVLSVEQLRAHPLLTTTMSSEPESIALQFTHEGGAEFELVCALLAKRLDDLVERDELPRIDTPRVAETMVRLSYTMVLIPAGRVPGRTSEEIRAFARAVILPVLQIA
jgi:AcrR family transcriptional regulator